MARIRLVSGTKGGGVFSPIVVRRVEVLLELEQTVNEERGETPVRRRVLQFMGPALVMPIGQLLHGAEGLMGRRSRPAERHVACAD
jgi:hypothetical protein